MVLMARLTSVTVRWPPRPGRHGRRQAGRGSWWCAGRTIRPARASRRYRAVPARVPTDTVVLPDEAYVEFLSPEHRSTGRPRRAVSQCRSVADVLEGLGWPVFGSATASARPTWPAGCGRCSCRSGSASPAWWPSPPPTTTPKRTTATYSDDLPEWRYSRMRLAVDGHLQPTATPTSCTCPSALARGFRRHRAAGAQLRRRQRADHGRQPAVNLAVLSAVSMAPR